jgi:hypothetical protein
MVVEVDDRMYDWDAAELGGWLMFGGGERLRACCSSLGLADRAPPWVRRDVALDRDELLRDAFRSWRTHG